MPAKLDDRAIEYLSKAEPTSLSLLPNMLEHASHWKTALDPEERSMPSSSQYVCPNSLSVIRASTRSFMPFDLLPVLSSDVLGFLEAELDFVSVCRFGAMALTRGTRCANARGLNGNCKTLWCGVKLIRRDAACQGGRTDSRPAVILDLAVH